MFYIPSPDDYVVKVTALNDALHGRENASPPLSAGIPVESSKSLCSNGIYKYM